MTNAVFHRTDFSFIACQTVEFTLFPNKVRNGKGLKITVRIEPTATETKQEKHMHTLTSWSNLAIYLSLK